MHYLKQFKKHIANGDYPGFLNLWEEYCEGDEIEADELRRILEAVQGTSLADPFGKYVDKGLQLWEGLEKDETAHEIFKLIIDLQNSNDTALGEEVLTYIDTYYGDDEHKVQKLKLVGLRDMLDFQGAVSNYELLTHLKPGNFVYHNSGWGVGEVMEVSFLTEQIHLEFDYVAGGKDLSFINAFRTLIPLKSDHFLARRFGNPDKFEAFAREHPVDTIRLLLRDLGPRTAQEIKDELCELVIPEEDWAKWWQATRTKVKKDTMIATPENPRGPFALRDAEETHEDRLHKALEQKPDLDAFIQLLYNFLRDFPTSLKNEAFREDLVKKVSEKLEEGVSDAQKIQLLFFLEDLSSSHPEVPSALIKELRSIEDVLNAIEVVSFKKRVLLEAKKVRSDWIPLFLDLLLIVDQLTLKDHVAAELLDAGKSAEVEAKLAHILQKPQQHAETLLWYSKKLMQKGADIPYSDAKGKCRFLEALFILLSHLERDMATNRDFVKKLHTFVTAGRFANVRKIFQHASIEAVQEFLLLASKCHSFENHDQKIFQSLAEVVHPSLSKLRKEEEPEEEIIWTTEEGLRKIQQKLEHIATVETVDNAKEIEEARAHGDLRENAEFKAAQERRARLQAEMKRLSDQIRIARPFKKEDITTDAVGIGTVVECKTPDGTATTYTLLGPWDADVEKNILSYHSKLAQEMHGRKVGDTFTLQSKELTITGIRNYYG